MKHKLNKVLKRFIKFMLLHFYFVIYKYEIKTNTTSKLHCFAIKMFNSVCGMCTRFNPLVCRVPNFPLPTKKIWQINRYINLQFIDFHCLSTCFRS